MAFVDGAKYKVQHVGGDALRYTLAPTSPGIGQAGVGWHVLTAYDSITIDNGSPVFCRVEKGAADLAITGPLQRLYYYGLSETSTPDRADLNIPAPGGLANLPPTAAWMRGTRYILAATRTDEPDLRYIGFHGFDDGNQIHTYERVPGQLVPPSETAAYKVWRSADPGNSIIAGLPLAVI